jgi:hypothetical protein
LRHAAFAAGCASHVACSHRIASLHITHSQRRSRGVGRSYRRHPRQCECAVWGVSIVLPISSLAPLRPVRARHRPPHNVFLTWRHTPLRTPRSASMTDIKWTRYTCVEPTLGRAALMRGSLLEARALAPMLVNPCPRLGLCASKNIARLQSNRVVWTLDFASRKPRHGRTRSEVTEDRTFPSATLPLTPTHQLACSHPTTRLPAVTVASVRARVHLCADVRG